MVGKWLGSKTVGAIAILFLMVFAGCLQDETKPASDTGDSVLPGANVTATLMLPKANGAIGHRICVNSATMCFPAGGGGGPAGGLPSVSGTQGNPYNTNVTGAPQTITVKVTWSGSGPGSNSNYEAVLLARPASGSGSCMGGGGGGQGGAPREIMRKTGASPLVLEVKEAGWKTTETCLRVQLYLTSRAPAGFVGVSSGDTFSVEGSYTTVITPPKAPASGNMTKG